MDILWLILYSQVSDHGHSAERRCRRAESPKAVTSNRETTLNHAAVCILGIHSCAAEDRPTSRAARSNSTVHSGHAFCHQKSHRPSCSATQSAGTYWSFAKKKYCNFGLVFQESADLHQPEYICQLFNVVENCSCYIFSQAVKINRICYRIFLIYSISGSIPHVVGGRVRSPPRSGSSSTVASTEIMLVIFTFVSISFPVPIPWQIPCAILPLL